MFAFRRYASLFFCVGAEVGDNELLILEIIHRYVEILDKYFGNVSICPFLFSNILSTSLVPKSFKRLKYFNFLTLPRILSTSYSKDKVKCCLLYAFSWLQML